MREKRNKFGRNAYTVSMKHILFRVVEPAWLAARVKEEAERIAALYAGEAQ